jgi:regulator of protease activity HflC (stomatin/prohibitin superfamily)
VNKKGNELVVGGVVLFLLALVVTGVVLLTGFDTVEAGSKGVLVTFGELQGTMEPGMKWTGPFTDVVTYDMKTRKMTVLMSGTHSAVDKDGQSVEAIIDINYKVNPANLEQVYSKVGLSEDIASRLNLDGIIREGFKTVTAEYTSLEIFQKRAEVKAKAIEKIKENFPSEYVELQNVIVSNIAFPPAFQAAINAKKAEEELAKKKEAEIAVKEAEARIAIATAEGKKQVSIKQSEAEAEKKTLAAAAEAEAIRVKAQAEADAIRLKLLAEAEGYEAINKQLTTLMVENNKIQMIADTWDGSVPTTVWSGADGSNMLLQVPGVN